MADDTGNPVEQPSKGPDKAVLERHPSSESAPAVRSGAVVASDEPDAFENDSSLLEKRDVRNPELVSANKEIQSANEEMQSSNEELQTVNDELQQRNATLTQTANDLSNLLNSVNLPVLMLSNELYIRHFTPPAQRLMNLRAPDIGRPFSDIRLNLRAGDLRPLFHEVLDTLTPREMEVQDREGRWYLLRVRPYQTTDHKIEGVVAILVDIDQLRTGLQEARAALDFASAVLESVPLPLAVLDPDFRIRTANSALRSLAALGKVDLDRRSFPDLAASLWGLEEPLRSHLANSVRSGDGGHDFVFEHLTPGDSSRVLEIRGRTLRPDGEMYLLVTVEDITVHKQTAQRLAMEREKLAGEVASTTGELRRTQDELRALAGSLFTSQEEERRRVARELHDDISQKLAVLEIDVQQIEPQISSLPAAARSELEGVRSAIGTLSEGVRRISHGLHPSVIEDLGLRPAIRSLVEDFRDREHVIVTFSAQEVPDGIPAETSTGLYRIAQEALRNIAKHAGKTHVKVFLRGEPGRIRLQVADSGEGFDPQARRSGLGLISMEERARLMRGTLTIESKPGEGTRVTADIPLP